MGRIHPEIERAGWRLARIRPSGKWAPAARVVRLLKDVGAGVSVEAEILANVGEGRGGFVSFRSWSEHDQEAGHLADPGVRAAMDSLIGALGHCGRGYPLTRAEHARQRAKMFDDARHIGDLRLEGRRDIYGPEAPPDARFPDARGGAAEAARAAEEHEPEPGV